MKIRIFCVGGTIDKIYFDAKSKYEVGAPSIGEILTEHDVGVDFEVTSLMAKDSLDMTDLDREQIRQAVESAAEQKIVITHGTDTMVATAKVLSAIENKTIVLTGSLVPAIFKDSDAIFNIGCAFAAAQMASPGVYVAMNGQIFSYDSVRKDLENNRFVYLE
ncbi:MAG: asparaginase [Gammaproteobacteria bacterium]|nr:asparaginase [Gammaproteobacteria bacterium]